MRDLEERIAGTRPEAAEVTPFDAHELVRRGRRQRQVGMLGAAAGLIAVVAGVAVLAANLFAPEQQVDVAAEPPGSVSARWSTIDMPIAPGASPLVGETSDGDLVVLGSDDPQAAGAILDTDTGGWRTIPPMPGQSPNFEGGQFSWALFEHDRIAVIGAIDGQVAGAWYDLDSETWTPIPPTSEIDTWGEAVAFDGSILAVVQTGFRGPDQRTPVDPRVARFDLEANTWSVGATPPFETRFYPRVASRAGLVFVHGGSLPDPEAAPDSPDGPVGARSEDNFLYDTTADEWHAIDQAPLTGGEARSTVWLDDDHIAIVNYEQQDLIDPAESVSDNHAAAIYQLSSSTWTEVTPPAQIVPDARINYRGWGDSRTRQSILIATSATASREPSQQPPPTAIYSPHNKRWIPGPEVRLAATEAVRDTLVALSGLNFRTSDQLDAHLRTADGRWIPATNDGPDARSSASVITIDHNIYVIGGHISGDRATSGVAALELDR